MNQNLGLVFLGAVVIIPVAIVAVLYPNTAAGVSALDILKVLAGLAGGFFFAGHFLGTARGLLNDQSDALLTATGTTPMPSPRTPSATSGNGTTGSGPSPTARPAAAPATDFAPPSYAQAPPA